MFVGPLHEVTGTANKGCVNSAVRCFINNQSIQLIEKIGTGHEN
jgi:hypothetical protein